MAEYSEEQRAQAWAEYYRQQGYDSSQIAAAVGQTGPSSANATAGTSAEAGQWQTYDNQPRSGTSTPTASSSRKALPAHLQRQVLDSDIFNQSSVYLPGAQQELVKQGKMKPPVGKRETVVRKGSGRTWEDATLLDWDPKWFRLFVGDVSNDVNERTLDEAFNKYPSYCKSKVVRDRLSEKAKYGFIAFKDPEDFLKAWKENDGKYIGNRPIRLSKIKDDKYGTIATVEVSGRKAKQLDKLRRNHGKPTDGRPVPW